MSDNPYAVPIGQSNVVDIDPESDDALAGDLTLTIEWMRECIEEYKEVEPKVTANANWFVRNDVDHPKYERNLEIFTDQQDAMYGLLDRLRSLRELGLGEVGRMSKDGEKKYKPRVNEFMELAEWVRTTRAEVAERDNRAF